MYNSLIDVGGLAYFYDSLKGIFAQTVNGNSIDENGNIQISQVPLAENLTSPDAEASVSSFIYRTSGGTASIETGEANLVFINGNTVANGRVSASATVEVSGDEIGMSVSSISSLKSAVSNTAGTYTLTYTRPTSSTATSEWTPGAGTWTYSGNTISLTTWGLSTTNFTTPSITIEKTGTGITAVTVTPSTFITAVDDTNDIYTFEYTGSAWTHDSATVTLSNYGIAVTGSPASGNTIDITYVSGTHNTTATVTYVAENRGELVSALPTSFRATGFNQFDPNNILSGYTIYNGVITTSANDDVCYCRAPGGDHGYIAKYVGDAVDGAINGIGWCKNVPVNGSVINPGDSNVVTASEAHCVYHEDGYIVVSMGKNRHTGLMMWCEWSGDKNDQSTYVAYTEPSTITIPTTGTQSGSSTDVSLPTATYGMPRIGNVYDTINFETGSYIKRIQRENYSSTRLAEIQAMDPVPAYDWDDNFIYYALSTPVVYSFTNTSGGSYQVDDHGTEEFVGTSVPVEAEVLYGQNLRDKLRTDVVTISAQDLTTAQQTQVRKNISAVGYVSQSLTDAEKTRACANIGALPTTSFYSYLKSRLVRTNHYIIGSSSSGITVAANTEKYNESTAPVTITKSGYYPIGIVGYSVSAGGQPNGSKINISRLKLNSASDGTAKIEYTIRNTTSSSVSDIKMIADILWINLS